MSLLQGIFLTFLRAPGRLFVPRERLGSENLGILLSLPSRMRPVLCPHQVSKCPDELADFTGDCSAALRPSFGGGGGGCVLFALGPSLAPHVPGLFCCSGALLYPACLSRDSTLKWQG